MKPYKAARRRKCPVTTPPSPPKETLADKVVMRFAAVGIVIGLLMIGYGQGYKYAATHRAVWTYLAQHHILPPNPDAWLWRQFERSHLPVAEAVAQSPTQSPERIYYIHSDHLGSPLLLTDTNAQVVWRANAEPFGKTTPTANQIVYNPRFPGQYHDEETGLDHNNHRTYASSIGKYREPDPIGLAGGINPYLYAANNPLGYIDPSGLYCVYQQLSGRMICYPFSPARPPESRNTSEVPGTPRGGLLPYYEETGYSGRGAGRNNPDMQGVYEVGPIPRLPWMYTGHPYSSPTTGKNTMQLVPFPGSECPPLRNCKTFLIHGNNPQNDASKGCIVLPPNRVTIPSHESIYVQ